MNTKTMTPGFQSLSEVMSFMQFCRKNRLKVCKFDGLEIEFADSAFGSAEEAGFEDLENKEKIKFSKYDGGEIEDILYHSSGDN